MKISPEHYPLFSFVIRRSFLCDVYYLKFIYSEKATKFGEISNLLLTTVHTVKSKVEISQNFVAFSEYMNFNLIYKFSHLCGVNVSSNIHIVKTRVSKN